MSRYRVAIVEMSQLLREIVVEALRSAGDIEVVAEEPDLASLGEVVAALRPDVILTGAETSRPSESWAQLLEERPPIRLLALTATGGATSFALVPVESTVEDVSPAELIDMIRGAEAKVPVN